MPQQRDCRGQEKTRKQQSVPRESGRVSKGGCVLKQPWAWGRRTLPGRLALVPTKQYPHVNTSHTWARTYTSNTSATYITMCTHLHSHMHIETHTHMLIHTLTLHSTHTNVCTHTSTHVLYAYSHMFTYKYMHSTHSSTHTFHTAIHTQVYSHTVTLKYTFTQ